MLTGEPVVDEQTDTEGPPPAGGPPPSPGAPAKPRRTGLTVAIAAVVLVAVAVVVVVVLPAHVALDAHAALARTGIECAHTTEHPWMFGTKLSCSLNDDSTVTFAEGGTAARDFAKGLGIPFVWVPNVIISADSDLLEHIADKLGAHVTNSGGHDPTAVERPATTIPIQKLGCSTEEAPLTVADLPSMSINLAEGHYLRVAISLGLCDDVVIAPGEQFRSGPARDIVVQMLSGRTMAELTDDASRLLVKEELTATIAAAYPGEVYEIYFVEFVLQ